MIGSQKGARSNLYFFGHGILDKKPFVMEAINLATGNAGFTHKAT